MKKISEADLAKLKGHTVVASVSGGKDSAALSLFLTENGIEHIRVFADTGWERAETYEYLRGPLTAKLGPIVEVRSSFTFASLVLHKRIFPDRTKRFCTEFLKVKPIKAFIDSLDDGLVVNAIGVRREESAKRRFAPDWEESDALGVSVWRPIAAWTKQDVIDIHKRHGLAPNPLYSLGASRVGCWPCIHARQEEISLVARVDPARIDEIRQLESEANRLAEEHLGEKPKWSRTMFSVYDTKKTEGDDGKVRRRHLPVIIDDAVAWAERGLARRAAGKIDLHDEERASCGEWGFCES